MTWQLRLSSSSFVDDERQMSSNIVLKVVHYEGSLLSTGQRS